MKFIKLYCDSALFSMILHFNSNFIEKRLTELLWQFYDRISFRREHRGGASVPFLSHCCSIPPICSTKGIFLILPLISLVCTWGWGVRKVLKRVQAHPVTQAPDASHFHQCALSLCTLSSSPCRCAVGSAPGKSVLASPLSLQMPASPWILDHRLLRKLSFPMVQETHKFVIFPAFSSVKEVVALLQFSVSESLCPL